MKFVRPNLYYKVVATIIIISLSGFDNDQQNQSRNWWLISKSEIQFLYRRVIKTQPRQLTAVRFIASRTKRLQQSAVRRMTSRTGQVQQQLLSVKARSSQCAEQRPRLRGANLFSLLLSLSRVSTTVCCPSSRTVRAWQVVIGIVTTSTVRPSVFSQRLMFFLCFKSRDLRCGGRSEMKYWKVLD